MSCTVGYLLLATFTAVVGRRVKNASIRRRANARAQRDARVFSEWEVVEVDNVHEARVCMYGYWETTEEMQEFAKRVGGRPKPVNIAHCDIRKYSLEDQKKLMSSKEPKKGILFIDRATRELVHKHHFDLFGEGVFDRKDARQTTMDDVKRGQEIYTKAPRKCDELGDCVCGGWCGSYSNEPREYTTHLASQKELLVDGWKDRFYRVTCGGLFRAVCHGFSEYFYCAEQAMKKIDFPTIAGGVYSSVAIFCDDYRELGFAPKCHEDKTDAFHCAILNVVGDGWMSYPTYNFSIEFSSWHMWLFNPHAMHCCSPTTGLKAGRVGVGLFTNRVCGAIGRNPNVHARVDKEETAEAGGLDFDAL